LFAELDVLFEHRVIVACCLVGVTKLESFDVCRDCVSRSHVIRNRRKMWHPPSGSAWLWQPSPAGKRAVVSLLSATKVLTLRWPAVLRRVQPASCPSLDLIRVHSEGTQYTTLSAACGVAYGEARHLSHPYLTLELDRSWTEQFELNP
jgi:hypothetical protein